MPGRLGLPWICATVLLIVPARPLRSAEPATPSAEARRWLDDARFGLFVHWGVSSLVGKGEWLMEQDKIPISEYEKLPPRFNPTEFDAQRWVKTIKEGGQKFLAVTVKQHDGFCMFDSALTRFDIVDATPYARDPLKDLAAACEKQGIRLFLYYSLLDWHHPDYFPPGKTGRHAGRDERGDWSRYVAYYQGQVRELCTHYGSIGGFLFDGWWDRPDADWDLQGTYRMIHDLQPGALVGNNHHGPPRPGEDVQIVEPERTGADEAAALPRLACETIDGAGAADVGASPASGAAESRRAAPIIRTLLGEAGRGSSLLLNVAPRYDGALAPEFSERLVEVGKWLEEHGQTVYGTRRGPIPPQPWGVSVSKPGPGPGTLYLHVLKPDVPIKLPRPWLGHDAWIEGKPGRLTMAAAGNEVVISLPEKDRAPIDTIIVLRPKGYER
jgi:alpha-L-fucosidase